MPRPPARRPVLLAKSLPPGGETWGGSEHSTGYDRVTLSVRSRPESFRESSKYEWSARPVPDVTLSIAERWPPRERVVSKPSGGGKLRAETKERNPDRLQTLEFLFADAKG